MLGVTEADAQMEEGADWARGHFYENGLKAVMPKLGFLFSPERFGRGMFNFLAMLHQAGVTTALDMGTGIYGNPVGEIAGVRAAANAYPVPVRHYSDADHCRLPHPGPVTRGGAWRDIGLASSNDDRVWWAITSNS
jgi:hypothetical protein